MSVLGTLCEAQRSRKKVSKIFGVLVLEKGRSWQIRCSAVEEREEKTKDGKTRVKLSEKSRCEVSKSALIVLGCIDALRFMNKRQCTEKLIFLYFHFSDEFLMTSTSLL